MFVLFWYVWKEETNDSYTVNQFWGFNFKFKEGSDHPLGKPCYRKRLVKTRVKSYENKSVYGKGAH